MKIFNDKNKTFLIKYKWVIIPCVPLLFFILFSLFFFSPGNETKVITLPSGIQSAPNTTINQKNPISDVEREGNEESVENRKGLQKKDVLPDGTTQYIFISTNPNRPHVIIAQGTHDILFQRTIMLPNVPVKISDYTQSYGNAKWVFKGSKFYGPDAQTYIYPERGFAFIGSSKSGEVFEQHVFEPLKVEDYVKKYGDDIPTQP